MYIYPGECNYKAFKPPQSKHQWMMVLLFQFLKLAEKKNCMCNIANAMLARDITQSCGLIVNLKYKPVLISRASPDTRTNKLQRWE